MKKRVFAIIMTMVMALGLSVSALSADIEIPSMGGASKLTMTDEIYTSYMVNFRYLYVMNQREKMEPLVMKLYDDYGLSVAVISEAFELDYSFVNEVVTRYTEGRDNTDYANKIYEEWKHMYDKDLPVDSKETPEGETDTEGSEIGSSTNPENPNTQSPSPGNPSASQNNPSASNPQSSLSSPPSPSPSPSPAPVASTVPSVIAEMQARNELLENIVKAKVEGNDALVEVYLKRLNVDNISFERMVTLTTGGVDGLKSLLAKSNADLSLFSDLLSEEFIAANSPKPANEMVPVDAAPTEPAAPSAPSVATASPTDSKVSIGENIVAFDAYHIAGFNFFKLRDLAYALTGSEKQFEVSWDAEESVISLISGSPYTVAGGEMVDAGSAAKTASITSARIFIDGVEKQFIAYNIDGNNYFKLRDIGQAFDFGIGWDADTNTINLYTDMPYMQ